MHWIHHYQLFLFDFDGILVNTEELHYLAYKKMCRDRGFLLPWSMATYVRHAMFSATGLREGVYREFPELEALEPRWEVLYQEKKGAYTTLLEEQGVELMPGVAPLLEQLEKAQIKRCVVTHSPIEQIARIKEKLPQLNSIPHWVTREDYAAPKPSPECYLKAIARFGEEGDRIVGFEDSPRGLKALLGTEADAYLVSEIFSKEEVASQVEGEFTLVPTLNTLHAP